MVKGRRLAALLLFMLIACLCLNCCTAPAYAFVPEQPEQTELNAVQDWSSPNALTPEGNLTLIDDVQTFSSSDKEFLTVQTKSGNYFYIIIERDSKGKQTVHFLNQVDESDLLALLEDEPVEKTPPVCICKGQEKCFIGSVNTSCEVCAEDMKSCLGKEITPAQDEPAPEKTSNPALAAVALLILLAMLGAGSFYLYKNYLSKKIVKQQPSDFDDDEEDDELEDYLDGEAEEQEEELAEDIGEMGDDEET